MPGCALTQDMPLDCRDQVGGSKEFYVIELEGVTALTVAAGVVTAITKATGKRFYYYPQVKQTADTDEDITPNEENGTLYTKQNVRMVFNRRQTAWRNEILLLAKNRLIIIEVDRNGNAWMFGAYNGMLMVPSKAKSGKAFGDRNGYELAFEGYETEPALSVQGTLLATLKTVGV